MEKIIFSFAFLLQPVILEHLSPDVPKLFIDSKTSEIQYSQGIDISGQVSRDTFRCFFQAGFITAFIRIYLPITNGIPDSNSIANIYNAAQEGMGVEVYIEPQPATTKSGTEQFLEAYAFLRENGIIMKAVWIKITSPIIWPNNQDANINFINEFIVSAEKYDLTVGIYTNWYDWQQITAERVGWFDQEKIRLWYWNVMGSGITAATPLSFEDFRPFGGFNIPMIKQYAERVIKCGMCVSLNIYTSRAKTLQLANINATAVGHLLF
uniref:Uncharacterized protein n=1 Tax=Setaria digitata TaxID=48799 RepID=A0A915PL38_9BILA